MTVKIEKGIPRPNGMGAPGYPKYPWKTMAIDDSFLATNVQSDSWIRSIRSRASRAGAKYNRKFSVRTTPEGIRVWRDQ